MPASKVHFVEYTEQQLWEMTREQAVDGLTEKRQRFCEYYISSHNAKTAAIKAGYDPDDAGNMASYMKRSPKTRRYIAWLKVRILDRCMVRGEELIEAWTRIAFSDITDFIDIFPTMIRLKPADQMDGQLVKSIKSGRDGISIELYDKMKALENLAKYVDCMPKDWKQRIEEQKLELAKQELELKKKTYGAIDTLANDGFLEAIANASKNISWESENNS